MKSILKSVVMGIALGATLFFLPVFIIGMLIFGLFFKMMFRRRMHQSFGSHRLAFADKIRNMSEEDFVKFKINFETRNFNGCSNPRANCNN